MAFQISKQPQYLFSIGQAYFFAKEYDEAQKNFAAYANVFTKDAQEFYRAFGFGPHRYTNMVRYPKL